MAINIGAMFAPSAAKSVTNFFLGKSGLFYDANIPSLAHQYLDGTISAENAAKLSDLASQMSVSGMDMTAFSQFYIEKLSAAYNYGFAVACISLVISVAIYYGCRSWFKHADVNSVQAKAAHVEEVELTPEQTKSRITALLLVFAVVVFFWMAFHQNGATMTIFARDYTSNLAEGFTRIGFNIWSLVLIAISIYTLFSTFQATVARTKVILGVVTLALWGGVAAIYLSMPAEVLIQPSDFPTVQSFLCGGINAGVFGYFWSFGFEG